MSKHADFLSALVSGLESEEDKGFFPEFPRHALLASGHRALASIDADVKRIENASDVLFPMISATPLSAAHGQKLAQLFREWRDDPPSIPALLLVAAEKLGIPADDNRHLAAATLTAIAADVPNDNPYHNNHHFREVVAAMARLCHVHKNIDGATPLSAQDFTLCLMAAAGHDLRHDGTGNNGVQYRLEDIAVTAMYPFLQLAKVDDETSIADLATMVRITDISAPAGGPSPHKSLKSIFNESAGAIPETLSALHNNKRLVAMAGLLSDADLTPSGATEYTFSRQMTSRLHEENPRLPDTDETLAKFMKFVVGGEFTSPAGKFAGQSAMDALFKQTVQKMPPALRKAL